MFCLVLGKDDSTFYFSDSCRLKLNNRIKMKTIFHLILLFILIAPIPLLSVDLTNGGFPEVKLITEELDFGEVKVGETKLLKIELVNVGSGDVEIFDITFDSNSNIFSNTDTVSIYNPLRIKEGKNIFLNVLFTPTDAIEYSNSLTLYSNAEFHNSNKVKLMGSGFSKPPEIYSSEKEITLHKSNEVDTSTKCFKLTNIGDGSLEIPFLFLESENSVFELEHNVETPFKLKNNESIEICIKLVTDEAGTFTNKIVIISNDEKQSVLKLPLLAIVIDPFSSVSDFPQSDELKILTNKVGDNVEFSVQSNTTLQSGTITIYTIEGREIKSSFSSNQTNNISINIKKNELPPLSIIRLRQGERFYT